MLNGMAFGSNITKSLNGILLALCSMFSSLIFSFSSLTFSYVFDVTRELAGSQVKGDQVVRTLAPPEHATQSTAKESKPI